MSRTGRLVCACVLLSYAPATALAVNYVRFESGGRSFVVDTDSYDVQKNLKPVNSQAGEQKLPAWLYPSPGMVPVRSHFDVQSGTVSATFETGGTVDQIAEYYRQLFASRGFQAGAPLGSSTSKIVSGASASGHVSMNVSQLTFGPRKGSIDVTVTFKPSVSKSGEKHFEAVWFDDTRALLCLRDTATGEDYYLEARGIIEANLNRPGAVASEGAPMPAWLPVYPGANRMKVQVIWTFEPTITFQTRASIRQVHDWYLNAVQAAGAKILSSGILRSGTPPKDFSAQIVAQMGDDVVDIRSGEIANLNPMPLAPQGPTGTGIGIRYTVPKK